MPIGVRLLPILAANVCRMTVTSISSPDFAPMAIASGTRVSSATSFVKSMELKKLKAIKTSDTFRLSLHPFKIRAETLSKRCSSSKAFTIIMILKRHASTLKSIYSAFGNEMKQLASASATEAVNTMSFFKTLKTFPSPLVNCSSYLVVIAAPLYIM